jgi:hypothetical protein
MLDIKAASLPELLAEIEARWADHEARTKDEIAAFRVRADQIDQDLINLRAMHDGISAEAERLRKIIAESQ